MDMRHWLKTCAFHAIIPTVYTILLNILQQQKIAP